ncbi:MAG: TonB-dependent hemoglobin/transferrin/lactoferrin family receptor [Pseudomonadota bacterium]
MFEDRSFAKSIAFVKEILSSRNLKKLTASLGVSSVVCSLLFPVAVSAQEDATKVQLDPIVVTATRTERPVSDVANTVTVIGSEQIERQVVKNIDDLIRYEPGVSVSGGGRFGLDGFRIRGIGGDRVLILTDGIPTADEFSFGPFLSSRRDFVDVDVIKSLEILRGPSSSVYGSNAIGGVVNFITKDPLDFLGDKNSFASIKLGADSVNDQANATVLGAFGNDESSGLVVVTARDYSETQTFFDDDTVGQARRSQNPQSGNDLNLFGKFIYSPDDSQELEFVFEQFNSDVDTDVESARNEVTRGVLTTDEIGVDEKDRQRISVRYTRDSETSAFDSFNVLLYSQSSESQQRTERNRLSFDSGPSFRTRDSLFEQDNLGVQLQFEKEIAGANSDHYITYGLDYDRNESSTLREGRTVSVPGGMVLREFSNFPTRDFPNSEHTSLGVFLQDEIALNQGRVRLIPALRFDNFELDPTADAIYLAGNTGTPTPEGYDESELSAKLGIVVDVNDEWSLFSQYAEGFRAPPMDAVNTGFTNFAGGYRTIPNADLEPESVQGFEIGARRNTANMSFEAAAYYNSYENFIESLVSQGFNPRSGLLEFQAENLPEATIKGFELRAETDLSSYGMNGFTMNLAYASSSGENDETNLPINSVDPQQVVLGLAYDAPSGKWGVETILTLSDGKDASDIDTSSLSERGGPPVPAFETSGYGVVDLIGYYNFSDSMGLNFGIFNIFDKEYFEWSEEFVQDPTTANFDRLTQPGINAAVNFKYTFR